jgi:hypothetical protein
MVFHLKDVIRRRDLNSVNGIKYTLEPELAERIFLPMFKKFIFQPFVMMSFILKGDPIDNNNSFYLY